MELANAEAAKPAAPTEAGARILSLDVLRGFALLGILLLNIVGMGMLSSAYSYPFGSVAGSGTTALDLGVWMSTEMFAEGAMRALFSMLFGAGVVLFTATRSANLHYRRTFWLLCFGLVDGFLLLWTGDILVVYALGGALLYALRDASPRALLAGAAGLVVLLLVVRVVVVSELPQLQNDYDDALRLEASGESLDAQQREAKEIWMDFSTGMLPDDQQALEELTARNKSYGSAFLWSFDTFSEVLLEATPFFLLWDALTGMLVGMALYKLGVLQGAKSQVFYLRLAIVGLLVGLSINAFELWRAIESDYDLITTNSFFQPTYDLGRLALASGYIGLVMWCCHNRLSAGALSGLTARLAAAGRMALTNYLLHSAIALLLFTGAGFGMAGEFDRWQLYLFVLLIWLFQLWFSAWWLARHAQGPIEALWRRLTYQ